MSEDNRTRLKHWLESGEARLHPLTFPQRELWESAPAPPGDVSNHICCFLHIRGALLPEHCEAAVQRVVDRQEGLRISFLPGKERPLQMVRRTGRANFHYQKLPASQRSAEAIEEIGREIFLKPFDMLQGPLHRVEMLEREPGDIVLAFAIHHAVADGWTLGVFVQDLCAAYLQVLMGNREPLPPVPMTYTEWGAAERALWHPTELAQRTAYWKRRLESAPRLWQDAAALTPPSRVPQRRAGAIPPQLTAAARHVARRSGATLFSTLLTAFQTALGQWAGATDIVVGTPVANRSKPAVRETMGYCSGILPLRGRIDADSTFAERLRVVHHETVDDMANAMPFAELAHALGDAPTGAHNPVCQVRFALQNHPVPDVTLPGLSARLRMRSTGTSRFDLGCELTEDGDALEVVWLTRPGMFANEDIDDLERRFHRVLEEGCASPGHRTAHLTH